MFRISPSTGTPPRPVMNNQSSSQQHYSNTNNTTPNNTTNQKQQLMQQDNQLSSPTTTQYPSPPTLSMFTNSTTSSSSDNASTNDSYMSDDSSNLRRRRDFDALSSMENTTPQGTMEEENQTVSFSNISAAQPTRNKKRKKNSSPNFEEISSPTSPKGRDTNNIELDDSFEQKFSKAISNFGDDSPVLNNDSCFTNRYTGPKFESTNKTIARYGDDNRTFIVGLLGYEFNESEIEVTPSNDSTGLLQRLGRMFSNIFSSTSLNQTLPFNNANAVTTSNSTLRHHTLQEDHTVIHSNPAVECELISHWREVPLLRNVKIKQISCGGYHVLLLTEDNVVYTSGWNKYGQLGTSKSGSSSKIVKIVENEQTDYCEVQSFHRIEFPEKIISLNASGRHSLFLSESGRVYGTGCNLHGRMGSEFIEPEELGLKQSQDLQQVTGNQILEPNINCGVFSPILLGGILKQKRAYYVGKAFWHSIIATCDGGVYVMGQSDEGKLGIGSVKANPIDQDTHCYEPTEIIELRGREIIEAEGGAWHTIFLTKAKSNELNNDLWVCGSNYWGQLALPPIGNKPVTSFLVPVIHPFFSGKRDPSKNAVQISAGSNFNAVLTEDGSIYCFGCGSSGKTGLGHARTVRTPIKVKSIPKDVIKISTGSNHLSVITKRGEMYSVGWNFYGQCGYDSDISNISRVEDTKTELSPSCDDMVESYIMPRIRRLTGVEVNSVGSGAYFTIITTSSTSNPIIRKQKEAKFKGIQVRRGFNDISVRCTK